jgi:hypothetical protein
MENLSRLDIVQLWIQNEQKYLYNLHLNMNYYNEDELLNQRMIARMFNKKQTEYFFAIKELEVTELKIKSCINLQELEQLLIQKNNLVETINFHIRIPSSLKYSWEEILTYIDNIENFSKKYYYL